METAYESTEQKRISIFSVKNIIRALLLLCIVFVFCPSFLVSCSEQEIEVGVMTAVEGVSMYGEAISEPRPIMLICLFIPIVMFALLFLKKNDKAIAGCIGILSIIDLMVWLKFKTEVEKIAGENYCSFETTGSYVVNNIVLILIALLAAMVIVTNVKLSNGFLTAFSKDDTQKVLNQMSQTMNQMSSNISKMLHNESGGGNIILGSNIMGFCQQCGAPIEQENVFCTSCGTPVPEDMIVEWQNSRNAKKYCNQCGMELIGDSVFCESCGTKVE